jgi:hypothetical protein
MLNLLPLPRTRGRGSEITLALGTLQRDTSLALPHAARVPNVKPEWRLRSTSSVHYTSIQ